MERKKWNGISFSYSISPCLPGLLIKNILETGLCYLEIFRDFSWSVVLRWIGIGYLKYSISLWMCLWYIYLAKDVNQLNNIWGLYLTWNFKIAVVKHPRSYYDFTTFHVLNLPWFAAFCLFCDKFNNLWAKIIVGKLRQIGAEYGILGGFLFMIKVLFICHGKLNGKYT